MKKKILALFEEFATSGGAEISNSLLLDYCTREYDVEKVFFRSHFLNFLPVNAALYFKVLLWKRQVRRLIIEKNPDIIVTQQHLTVVSHLAAEKFNIPIISFVRDWWFLTPNREEFEKYATVPHMHLTKKGIGVLDYAFSRWSSSSIKNAMQSVKVIAVSCFVRSKLNESLGVIAEVVTPPVEDYFYIGKPALKEKFKNKSIVFIGRITAEKGVHIAIKAMEKIDAKLTIIGLRKGAYFEYCKRIARMPNIKGKVVFTGKLGSALIIEYIKKSTCVIVPSMWQEPFGRVSIEAMATGTPVIASSNGGIPESSKSIIIARTTPEEFSKKIAYLTKDFSRYESVSRHSQADSKKYSLENTGRQFLKILSGTQKRVRRG